MEPIPIMLDALQSLRNIADPFTGCDLIEQGSVKTCQMLESGVLNLNLELGYPLNQTQQDFFETYLKTKLNKKINLKINSVIRRHVVQNDLPLSKRVKNTIAVASGKGGVGKSTVALNLALSLLEQGLKVGLLDADIYGPSQPTLLQHQGRKALINGQSLEPIEYLGLQTMSISYLMEEESPVIWRGPMVSSALQQMFHQTAWPDLDYLIIDMPPGTGDIALSLVQKIPVTGALIITTPQELAVMDAKKALAMFLKTGVKVLGVVENMSSFHCQHCSHAHAVFGSGGGQALAEAYQVPLLAQIPLEHSAEKLKASYQELALKTTARLSLQPRAKSLAFMTVSINS
ncbi:MAG: P-loop NTPase [Gammaproteobacteria bacterium]